MYKYRRVIVSVIAIVLALVIILGLVASVLVCAVKRCAFRLSS